MTSNPKTQTSGSELQTSETTNPLISFDDLDSFFDEFLSRKWPRLLEWNFPLGMEKTWPKLDVIDHDKELEIQAALPGIKKQDLEIAINNHCLTIKASNQQDKTTEGKYYRREICRGSLQRTISLPANIDENKADASFSDGILKITIPKTASSTIKTIAIH